MIHDTPSKDDLVPWSRDLSIGIDEVDDQHHYLVDRINRLWRALLQKREADEVILLIEDLYSYTQTHFVAEEALMQSFDYPRLPEHRVSHRAFEAHIREAADGLVDGKPVTHDLLHFLNEWLKRHILVADQDYATFIERRHHGGILGRFSSLFHAFSSLGKGARQAHSEAVGLHGLDMQKAIDIHIDWIRRLKAMIEGKGQIIAAGEAVRDDRCMLGNWIAANATGGLESLEEFQRLKRDHSKFHLHAGMVVGYHESGSKAEAMLLLRSDLRELSNEIRLDIIQLYAAWHRLDR